MADNSNTTIVMIGIAALAFMGFLYWKSIQQPGTVALQPARTTITEFVRDKEGRVIQILERG